ncbi:MAG: MarC family protein [Candidatus Bathyarchaeia archaeon]
MSDLVETALNLARAVVSLFIIVDPIGNLPILISLTQNMPEDRRRNAFRTATITGLILLLSFASVGQQILALFGVSLHNFMVAGGILLLIIAVKILIAGGWEDEDATPESVGAVPIAVPLLVGPGAITTTIINIQAYGFPVTIASVLITFAFVWFIFKFIDSIYAFLGRTGSLVIARVMALLIAAIAIRYILEGLSHYL